MSSERADSIEDLPIKNILVVKNPKSCAPNINNFEVEKEKEKENENDIDIDIEDNDNDNSILNISDSFSYLSEKTLQKSFSF